MPEVGTYRSMGIINRPMFKAAKKYFGNKPVVGVEVGSGAGGNAVNILSGWKEITKLWCVDCWLIYQGYTDFIKESDQTQLRNECIIATVFHPRMHIIIDLSVEATKRFKDKSVDFVYIDANHAYKYVKEDILAWTPKVKKGGIIGGHDLDWEDPEKKGEFAVKKAVEEIFGSALVKNTKINYGIYIYEIDELNCNARIDSDWWVFV